MITKASKICSLLVITILLFSCSKELDSSIILSQNDENTLLSFNLLQADNSALADGDNIGVIDQENRTVDFLFPFGTNVTSVIPEIIISEDATITPASGVAQDFTNPVSYTVTAENGSQLSYTITIRLPELSERQALLNMYDPDLFIEEERWDLDATDINTWRGVTAVDGKVISLSFNNDYKFNITSDVINLIHLERLTVFDTNIDIADEIGSLTTLKSIDFEVSNISGGIQWIENLSNLETLSFYDNGGSSAIETLDFSNLKKLTRLTIEISNISTLSESINELTALTTLDLEENNITELPDLSGLVNLLTLDLSDNNLTELSNLSSLNSLETLDVSDNNLTELPTDLTDLMSLKTLRLSDNNISDISSITQLTNLETFFLSSNSISTIPTDIGNLTNLTALSLSSNMIETIPAEVGSLINLTSLTLSNNLITTIPTFIGNLTNLTSLTLSGNSITSIPTQVGNLEELTFLRLNNNMIEDGRVPEELGRLTGLTTLDLRTNLLTTVPISVCDLANTGTTVSLDAGVTCN